jgi:hypothetical protein
MFIPEGLMLLRTAVEEIAAEVDPTSMAVQKPYAALRAESLNPLNALSLLPVSSELPKPLTEAERQEIDDWEQIKSKQNEAREEARRRIRRILGNGWEHATAQRSDGTHIKLAAEPWRTKEGTRALSSGNLIANGIFTEEPMDAAESWPVFVEGSIVQKCLDPKWKPVPSPTAANNQARVQRTGGRPPKHDWLPFTRKVIRLAFLDGGNLTRTELRKQMKDWAEVNMPDADDRTVEKKLAELVPDDLLTE